VSDWILGTWSEHHVRVGDGRHGENWHDIPSSHTHTDVIAHHRNPGPHPLRHLATLRSQMTLATLRLQMTLARLMLASTLTSCEPRLDWCQPTLLHGDLHIHRFIRGCLHVSCSQPSLCLLGPSRSGPDLGPSHCSDWNTCIAREEAMRDAMLLFLGDFVTLALASRVMGAVACWNGKSGDFKASGSSAVMERCADVVSGAASNRRFNRYVTRSRPVPSFVLGCRVLMFQVVCLL
jgi:hypothetical protein